MNLFIKDMAIHIFGFHLNRVTWSGYRQFRSGVTRFQKQKSSSTGQKVWTVALGQDHAERPFHFGQRTWGLYLFMLAVLP